MTSAIIISIGDELLIGNTVNTNAAYIAREINKCGIDVKEIITIADHADDIAHALKRAAVAQLVIITGGLGPTSDDITKMTLCKFFHTGLKEHAETLKHIESLWATRNQPLSTVNRKQAEIPECSTPIRNELGTAPGLWFSQNNTHYFALPGVPFEMMHIMEHEIIPLLKKLFPGNPIIHKTILTTGTGESALAEQICEWEAQLSNHLKLAYLPEPGIIRLRLTCKSLPQTEAEKIIAHEISKLKIIIPRLIFGYDDDSLEKVTGNLLINRHKTLSTAESCTGGYIAHLITAVPGSSAYFRGSVVAYHNQAKIELLNVKEKILEDHGAVSREVVTSMAEAARQLLHTDYALAVSGIAGPDGGSPEKPVGTVWIALAGPESTKAELFHFSTGRDRNIRRAGLFALNMLRLELMDYKS